jgi:hypothetical protein
VTKTPIQVASHPQKYYKRQKQKFDDKSKDIKRNPRTSIHDTTISAAIHTHMQDSL